MNSKTKVTIGFIIAVVTLLTPAIGSLLATRQEAQANTVINSRQDSDIKTLSDKMTEQEKINRQIVEDLGYIRGQVDRIPKRR